MMVNMMLMMTGDYHDLDDNFFKFIFFRYDYAHPIIVHIVVITIDHQVLDIDSRSNIKRVMDQMQAKILQGRNLVTRKVMYTNLTDLNVSRNALGPAVVASLMYSLQAANCTITSIDVSDNPLGYTIKNAGDASAAALDTRGALGKNVSLTALVRGTESVCD